MKILMAKSIAAILTGKILGQWLSTLPLPNPYLTPVLSIDGYALRPVIFWVVFI
jgi:hypothetical protein